MTRRVGIVVSSGLVLALLSLLSLLACGDPAPPVDLAGMEPAVRELIESRRAAVNDSADERTWGGLGDALLAHGLERDAAAAYARAVASSKEPFPWLYLQALATGKETAQAEQAIELFRQAAMLAPDNALVELRIALLLQSLGRHEDALASFEDALALDDKLQRAHRGRGQELLLLGRAGPAIEALERAVTLASDDGAGWSALAQAYAASSRGDEAREAARNAERGQAGRGFHDPLWEEHVLQSGVSSSRRFQRALGALAEDDPAEARLHVEAILQLRENNADALYLMGLIENGAGNVAAAERRFSRALETDPRHARSLLEIARLRHRAGDLEGVVRTLERLIAVQPEDVSTHLDLGDLYLHLERWTEAEARFREAVRLDPGLAEAHDRLKLARERRAN